MNNFSTYVGIIAGLAGIAAAIAALLEKNKIDPKRLAIILSILGVVILSGVFFATSTTITPHPPTNPFTPKVQAPTDTPTPTPTEPALTPISSPELHPTATLDERIVLQSSGSDPLVVTITKIVIEPQENRMRWSLTLRNTSQGEIGSGMLDLFSLQEGDQSHDPSPEKQKYNPSGPGVSNNLFLPAFPVGTAQQIVITFSFVPYINFPYTLTSEFSDGSTPGTIRFDPTVITLP